MKTLSKSKYLIGLKCHRHLWMLVHEPEKIPEVDATTQHKFDQGRLVGEWAKKLFPEAVDLTGTYNKENIKKTKEFIKKRRIIFEAGITSKTKDGDLFSRADVLIPVERRMWDVIEIKSSTKVKDEHIEDLSFQKYCYEKAGLKINKCFLMRINNQYVKQGEIEPDLLFEKDDLTEDLHEARQVEENIKELFKVIRAKKPTRDTEYHCVGPKECQLDECWDFLPPSSVFELHRGGKKSFELFEQGIYAIGDIPDEFKLTINQEIQRNCVRTKKTCINKPAIKSFLDNLEYPLHCLDFETISFAIPQFDGTSPYQNIPFQFSLHIVNKPGFKSEHKSFLAKGKEDPRPELLEALKKAIGDKGSIVVYNQSFENQVLMELAEEFPFHKEWILKAIDRIVDLYIPFQKFYYYNPKQKGSGSLKDVLPALIGKKLPGGRKNYEQMEISEGGTASLEYLKVEVNNAGDVDEKERENVRRQLEEYCELDTLSMVWILERLKGLSE